MSSIKNKILTLPLLICFVFLLVGVSAFGFAGCSSTATVKITFDAAGGYFVTGDGNKNTLVLELEQGSDIEVPSEPIRDSSNTIIYTFDGWDIDVPETATSDIIIKAKWATSTRYYTVTFDANGGTYSTNSGSVSSVTVNNYQYGQALSMPNNPTREATEGSTFVFAGYDKTVPSTVTVSATYVAKWTEVKNTYTVVYNANGGKFNNGNSLVDSLTIEDIEYGSSVNIDLDSDLPGYEFLPPESTNTTEYVFGGWSKTASGNDIVTTVTDNITVYAVWVANERLYDITFDAGEGRFANGAQTKTFKFEYGESIVFPSTEIKPSRTMTEAYIYNFQGFDIPSSAVVTGNATFHAIWAQATRTYDVVFDAGEGYFGTTSKKTITLKFDFNAKITAPQVQPVKDSTPQLDYTFDGYEGLSNDTIVTGEGMRFVARYTESARTYVVTFYAGTGASFDTDAGYVSFVTKSFEYGERIVAPDIIPSKEATTSEVYSFAGYLYLTDQTKVTGEGMSFTASYTPATRQYDITFDAGEGNTFDNGERYVVLKFDYNTRPSFDFEEYGMPSKVENDYATYEFVYFNPGYNNVTSDTTYTAVYEEILKQYTVEFYDELNGELIYSTKFTASKDGTPTLSAEQMSALQNASSSLDTDDFYGYWSFTLKNRDMVFYATINGVNSSYIRGDGKTAETAYMINDFAGILQMNKMLNQSFAQYQASVDNKAQIVQEASNVYYRIVADIDYSSDKTAQIPTNWFIGHLDAAKPDGSGNYKLYNIDATRLNDYPLYVNLFNAEISNLDIYLGEGLVTFGGYAYGDYVVYDNVDVYNEEGVQYTILTANDNNESAYIYHSYAESLTFENCDSYVNYNSRASYFGIFLGGYTSGSSTYQYKLTYKNCVNYGDVFASGKVGMLYGNGAHRNFDLESGITIQNCENKGNIISTNSQLFVGIYGNDGVNQEAAEKLGSKVTNTGTLQQMTKLEGTATHTNKGLTFTAKNGAKFSAGTYYLDTMLYANSYSVTTGEKTGTLRVNCLYEVVLPEEADALVFSKDGFFIDRFIDKYSYEMAWGQDAFEALDNEYDLEGYNITYRVDTVRGLLVFNFDDYSTTDYYRLSPSSSLSSTITAVNSDGNTIGYADITVKSNNQEIAYVTNESTLRSAINGNASEIVLLSNIEIASKITVNTDREFTLNLAGCEITASEDFAGNGLIEIEKGTMNVINGEVNVNTKSAVMAFRINGLVDDSHIIDNPAKLILGANLKVYSSQSCCVFLKGIRAELVTSADMESAGVYATIQGNGSVNNQVKSIEINGGSIVNENAVAIYVPHAGNYLISGGTIKGLSAMYIKCGNLTITGGNFIATEEASEYQYNGSGCNSTGDALIIEACNYPGGTPSVVISGGNFTSAHNKGIAYYQYSETVNDEEVVYAGEVIVYDSVGSTTTDNITKVSATLGQ